jgi:hypothetical protein
MGLGFFDSLRGIGRSSSAQTTSDHHGNEKVEPKGVSDATDTDSDRLSLEERNEKEVQQHPEEITHDAQAGQQKAEAVALVWSKPALYAT